MYHEIIESNLDKIDKSLLTEITDETSRIKAVDWVNSIAKEIGDIEGLSFDIVLKNKSMFLLCKFNNAAGVICKGGNKVVNGLDKSLEYLLTSISNGQVAIKLLNDKISKIQADNGIIISMRFRWGFGKASEVAYWDYTNLIIQLNETSIAKLSKAVEDNTINSLIDEATDGFKWADTVSEVISEYNNTCLSNVLESKFAYDSILEALQDNMLEQNDIVAILRKNLDKHSSQKIKSVYTISELGLFAAILLWYIDYDLHSITVDILEDKVLDVENGRFVSDHSLYSRIEQKIKDETDKIASDFRSWARN